MDIVWLDRHKDVTVDEILKLAFPSYRGNRIAAIVAEKILFWGTMWDAGNRRTYRAVNLANYRTATGIQHFLQESPTHNTYFEIPAGMVVVVYIEGPKDSVEIYASAGSITPMLPAPVELSEDERIVLVATRKFVSSYRYQEARRESGITKARWEVAKATLIARKFLRSNGSISTEGKNAIGRAEFPANPCAGQEPLIIPDTTTLPADPTNSSISSNPGHNLDSARRSFI